MQATNSRPRFEVVADGQDICSHVGAALLGELADRLGLTVSLAAAPTVGCALAPTTADRCCATWW